MTPDAILQRFDESDEGTFGVLTAGELHLYTGELPDRGNEPTFSRVEPSAYWTAFTPSPRFKRCLYLLARVPRRSGIRLHSANLMGDSRKGLRSQLNGCIALGERLGHMEGQKALLLSAPAVRRLEQYFAGRPFILDIRNPI